MQLRTAQDYATTLNLHVNYLNRAVKEITGKSTTTHITEWIASEAKALLLHTDWNVADIAYALGFEYPTYFNNFFKGLPGQIPCRLDQENHKRMDIFKRMLAECIIRNDENGRIMKGCFQNAEIIPGT